LGFEDAEKPTDVAMKVVSACIVMAESLSHRLP